MRALAAAWITTLLIYAATALALQLTYEPSPPITAPAPDATQIPAPAPQIQVPDSTVQEGATSTSDQPPSEPDTSTVGAVEPDQASVPETGSEAEAGAGAPSTPIAGGEGTAAEPAAGDFANTPPPSSVQIQPVDPFLQEEGPYGPLPLTRNGRQPWQVYRRNVSTPPDMPVAAIVITGMGLNSSLTARAVNELPGDITLAFSPYGQRLASQANAARSAGHETLLMIPMEPQEYPLHDPGPQTLLATDPPDANLDKLYYVLSRFQGYVGVINEMGSKFTASAEALAPIMLDLQKRGLVFVDSRSSRYSVAARSAMEHDVPHALNSRFIDDDLTPEAIDSQLTLLERTALRTGIAVGIAHPYPISVERIRVWAEGLSARGVALAPITAVVNRQAVK